MNLSWFDTQTEELATDLVEEESTLEISYENEILFAGKSIWVQNNGQETNDIANLIDFGFYVDATVTDELTPILKLASENDGDGKPYGMFIVFGYTDDTGTDSNIDGFINNVLPAEEMLKFQVNWNQGINGLNKIGLDKTYTFNGTNYVLRNSFPVTYPSNSNSLGENRGKIKIYVCLRYPTLGPTYTSNLNIKAFAIGEE